MVPLIQPKDPDQSGPGGLETTLEVLRRRWLLILATILLTAGAAYSVSTLQEDVYTADASVLLRDPALEQKVLGSEFASPDEDELRTATTALDLINLDVVARRAAEALGRADSESLSDKIAVETNDNSNLLTIQATDRNPRFAADLATTFAREYIDFRKQADQSTLSNAVEAAEQQLAEAQRANDVAQVGPLAARIQDLRVLTLLQTGDVELAQTAAIPTSPSAPKPVRNAILGLLAGIFLGVALAFVREQRDNRLRTEDAVSQTYDLPVVGEVPRLPGHRRRGARLTAGEAEAFRMMWVSIRSVAQQSLRSDRELKSLVVTSGGPEEGKSTVARYLAAAAASTGQKVMLLEADLHRPSQSATLESTHFDVGLTDILEGRASIADATQQLLVPLTAKSTNGESGTSIGFISAGPIHPNPIRLISSEPMWTTLGQLEDEYDLVIVDAPPAGLVSDATQLMSLGSGVIVVARTGTVTRRMATGVRTQLDRIGVPFIGLVINFSQRASRDRYSYGYAYTERAPARAESKT